MADAVRFSIVEEDALRLRIVYVLENEHAPAQFGTLEYGIGAGAVLPPCPDAVLARQAEAFAQNYIASANANWLEPPDIVL